VISAPILPARRLTPSLVAVVIVLVMVEPFPCADLTAGMVTEQRGHARLTAGMVTE
jgi:hypothetical protein